MQFTIAANPGDTAGRAGVITTDRGTIETPIFMPVGTVGTVKTITQQQLKDTVKAEIILGNTFHLYLRPGMDILTAAGGLHQFIGWDRPMLTDSGGYQVYSLAVNRKIKEEGVRFQSHIDGSYHTFTPESAIDIQRQIGADIIMAFDECTPYPCEYDYAKDSMHLTHRWLKRCLQQFDATEPLYGKAQTLFPIVQGSVYPDLREQSAACIAEQGAEGNAIGGLSVGEPHEDMYAMTDLVCNILPQDKPRYLMGVGTPANLLECIHLGIDMFDCVMPTRNGRNGMLFTAEGIINIKNKKWANDFTPIDPDGAAPTSRYYTKAYLRHLFQAREILGMHLGSLHNLSFYLWLMKEARQHLMAGDFANWKNRMVPKLTNRL